MGGWLRNVHKRTIVNLTSYYCPIVDCGGVSEGAGRGSPTPGDRSEPLGTGVDVTS